VPQQSECIGVKLPLCVYHTRTAPVKLQCSNVKATVKPVLRQVWTDLSTFMLSQLVVPRPPVKGPSAHHATQEIVEQCFHLYQSGKPKLRSSRCIGGGRSNFTRVKNDVLFFFNDMQQQQQ
jgi:hypothetical protein